MNGALGLQQRVVSFESLRLSRLPPHDAARFAARAVYETRVAVGGRTIAVRFSRRSAAARFARRFVDMPGHEAPNLTVHAVDVPGEAYFWSSAERARHWAGDLDDDLLVFFADNVALHEYLTTSADVGLHAAVIAKAGRAVALVGTSTAGKTTTAIAAVRHGFALYSDERCIVQDGRVVPFLRTLTVRAGGRSALLATALPGCAIDLTLRALPERGEASIAPRALVGERAGGPPLTLAAIFVITGRAAAPVVDVRSLYGALPALLRSMQSREAGIDRAARALTEFRDVALFGLQLGTPAATVDAIERTLDEALAGAHR